MSGGCVSFIFEEQFWPDEQRTEDQLLHAVNNETGEEDGVFT